MQDLKNRTETGQKKAAAEVKRYGKDHVNYWKARVQKRSYSHAGTETEVSGWQVRLWHKGREGWFNLDTDNCDIAATRAREIYRFLRANGWETTLLKYKGPTLEKCSTLTVGEYIEAVRAIIDVSAGAFEQYVRRLRLIASSLLKPSKDICKYDYVNGGTEAWHRQIDAIPLRLLTPERVQQWKKEYVLSKGTDPVKLKAAEATVNSHMRNAKALFTKEILGRLKGMTLPSPLPFEGVNLFRQSLPHYRSSVDPIKLLAEAKTDFENKPELYKIFLLCLLVGLRRNEVDKLKWSSILWDKGAIRIEAHESFSPKTRSSEGDVPVEPEVMQILLKYKETSSSVFVIESDVEVKASATYFHYRANKHFENLITWLRLKGISGQKPIHTLRKEFGRLITEKHGIFAASKLLRHASIAITAAYYADDTRRLTVGLGSQV